MDQTAIEDLNRKLAELTAPLWFTATVREIPPDQEDTPPGEGEILFQAVTWRGNERLEHTAAYPVGDVESFGCDVVASRFVDAARQALPHGTRSTL
jgi:hypothetical protein